MDLIIKVAAVKVQEDHCPPLRSFSFIVRRTGLGNAFQNCYITAVTGTDVDLSFYDSREGFGCGGTKRHER